MQVKSSELLQTEVVAALDSVLQSNKNLVYCATFQIVWNQLADEIIKSPISLEKNLPIVQKLNQRRSGKDDISADYYLAMAGLGREGIVEKIQNSLREMFNRQAVFGFRTIAPDDILTYAYLEKSIPFEVTFDVFDESLIFLDNVPVQSFGVVKSDAAADQVQILDYSSNDDFVLRFCSPIFQKWKIQREGKKYQPKITDDIILAKVTPRLTLLETIEYVMERIRTSAYRESMLDSNVPEILQIPKIDLDILHQYAEFEGLSLANPDFQNYRILQALQAIKFNLDESGAKVSSEGFTHLSFGVSEQERRFVFDKPFLVYFQEKQARYPYLAFWIGNSELLVKA